MVKGIELILPDEERARGEARALVTHGEAFLTVAVREGEIQSRIVIPNRYPLESVRQMLNEVDAAVLRIRNLYKLTPGTKP